MSKTERAGELVLGSLQCTKMGDIPEAARQMDEAIECIKYAILYENFGSTGLYILNQRLKQYSKYVANLRLKMPAEDMQNHHDVQRLESAQNVPIVSSHDVAAHDVMVTIVDEPDFAQLITGSIHHTPDRSLGDDLFHTIPGQSNNKHLETAVNFAKKAVEVEQENNIAEALDLYSKAIDFFTLSINDELTSEASRKLIRPQVNYCRTRVEELSCTATENKWDCPVVEDEALDREPGSTSGDTLGDQATLQRRPVARPEVVGLDLVRATLLNAVIGENTSFQRILLVGATGTGKTLLVDNLFRNTSDCFYVYRDGSVFDPPDGVLSESITELFEDARQHKPSVIFFDKIDSLFPQGRLVRTSRDMVHKETSYQLLEQLNDLNGRNEKIVFISATDSPWYIGPEIRDRFDCVVYTSLPNLDERIAIAKLNAFNLLHTLSEDDFVTIAHKTKGFTGADIESTMRKAVISTIMELHEATHFKEVELDDSNTPAAWTPCSPDDPQAVSMLWSDKVQIHPPEVTMKHVLDSLDDQVSSVSSYEEYRLRNWVLLSGRAPAEQVPSLQQPMDMNMQCPPGEPTPKPAGHQPKGVVVVQEEDPVVVEVAMGRDNASESASSSLSKVMVEIAVQTDMDMGCVVQGGSTATFREGFLRSDKATDPLSKQSDMIAMTVPLQLATTTGDQQVRVSSGSLVAEPSFLEKIMYPQGSNDCQKDSDHNYTVPSCSTQVTKYVSRKEPSEPGTAEHVGMVDEIEHLNMGPSIGKTSIVDGNLIIQGVQQPIVMQMPLPERSLKVKGQVEENTPQSHTPIRTSLLGPEGSPALRTMSQEEDVEPGPSVKDIIEPDRLTEKQSQLPTPLVDLSLTNESTMEALFNASMGVQRSQEQVGTIKASETELENAEAKIMSWDILEEPSYVPEAGGVDTALMIKNVSNKEDKLQREDPNDDAVYVVADLDTWNSLNDVVSVKSQEQKVGREDAFVDDDDDEKRQKMAHTVLLDQQEGIVTKQSIEPVVPEKPQEESKHIPPVDKATQLASGVAAGLVWDMSETMDENKQHLVDRADEALKAGDTNEETATKSITRSADAQKTNEASEDRKVEEPDEEKTNPEKKARSIIAEVQHDEVAKIKPQDFDKSATVAYDNNAQNDLAK